MGTDIHLFAEALTVNGWEYIPAPDDKGKAELWEHDGWYRERNYWLFACLADVRNYDNRFVPIVHERRGVPDDASEEYKAIAMESGGSRHHWLTLEEVADYEWADIQAKSFDDDVVSPLLAIADERGLSWDNVRLVFFFDS